MADDTNDTVGSFLGSMGNSQKIFFAVVIAVVLGSILFFVVRSSKPEMTVLYSNLNSDDTNAILSDLAKDDIPVEVGGNGTLIMVPKKDVYSIRMKLAAKGLPHGSVVGFEIFDKTDFGVTDFVQKVNYQRALEGELSRTISHLAEVKRAKVHLVLPDKSLFVEEEKKTAASVVLKLRQGAKLKRSQVDGIVRLVSSAVENLLPGGVAIIDSHGNILSQNFDEDIPAQLTISQIEIQRKTEKKLEKSVETMLNRVLGSTHSVVRVHATLNFNKVEKTEEIYDPKTVVRSEQRSTSESRGSLAPQQGIPGVQTNLGLGQATPGTTPPGTVPITPGTPATSAQESETINYDINKIVRHTKMSYGEVIRLSIAVIVDGTYEIAGKKKNYISRTPEEMESLTALVRGAIGFQEDRGDEISVRNIAFFAGNPMDLTMEKEEAVKLEKKERWGRYLNIVKYISYPLAIIFIFLFLLKPMFRVITEANQPLPEPSSDERPRFVIEESEKASGPKVLRKARSLDDVEQEAEAMVDADLEVTPEKMRTKVLKKKVIDIVNRDPKAASMLIRSWISEKS